MYLDFDESHNLQDIINLAAATKVNEQPKDSTFEALCGKFKFKQIFNFRTSLNH